MVKRSSIHKILVAVLVSASLVGCGVSNETDSTAGSESSVDIKAASSPDSQAIEKVNTLFSMAPAAQQAKEVATAQCLQEQNLTWPQRPTSQSFSIRSQLSPSPLSPEDAQQYGYQTPTTNVEQNLPAIDDASWAAYMGNPENGGISVEGVPGAIAADGCLAQSYKAVFGSAEAGVLFESGILNLPLPYVNAVKEDERYSDLIGLWRTCMKDHHGVEIDNPDLATIDTSMDSHQLAIYDAQCRQQVNFEEVTTDILNAYLTTFLADNEGVIDQLTQAKRMAEKNAPEILSKS
ncbi:MAG TPA: hypothetical protein H9908_03390 [Candidatus Rothia avistercoris]|uniref:Uncharacterized protein n=1 Tax=Candidatus Rothia avistercoris TaxID=2840479 RepID=A0A9D2UEE8_9MICC|nr:hypothetical protein [Candidatus Rothia avistercoris]